MSLALDLTYRDCQSVLDKVAKVHAHRFHRDYDTVRANANSIFLAAYHRYDYRGRFEDYLAQFVHRKLRDEWRSEQRYQAHAQNAARQRSDCYEQTEFILGDFLGGLNEDAASLVRVALQGADLNKGNRGRGNKRGISRVHKNKGMHKGRPESRIGSIRRYLVRLGWTTWRVTKAIHEIREKL